jgi:hypothetical protein
MTYLAEKPVSPRIVQYLNRLSDLLFVMAQVSQHAGRASPMCLGKSRRGRRGGGISCRLSVVRWAVGSGQWAVGSRR